MISQKKKKNRQLLFVFSSPIKKCQSNKALCVAMLFANIPWYKLENVKFREFSQEYTGKEATFREDYVDDCKVKKKKKRYKTWTEIADKNIWCLWYIWYPRQLSA